MRLGILRLYFGAICESRAISRTGDRPRRQHNGIGQVLLRRNCWNCLHRSIALDMRCHAYRCIVSVFFAYMTDITMPCP